MCARYRFHLIANAHLDPVWLWDWREGLNEALNTTRTMLDLLDEFPDLTVVRGESALYAFIEREAPGLFARICAHVAAGRWEAVGGTCVQSDTNLPATATLLRQFEEGQRYFRERFGRATDTAWFPDSFGHSAGLPEILAASGIANFAHCRPFKSTLPLAESAYWWEGAGGARVLAYRSPVDWYCNEQRDTLPTRLDAYLAKAKKSSLRTVAVFYGLGNHGGGPTRRMLHELRAWGAAHEGEVKLVHSGLSRTFAAVRAELAARPELALPIVRGELNFCLRGCYVSTAKIKFPYRRTEHQLLRAGRMIALAAAGAPNAPRTDLGDAWRALLFNSFHDILPGTSIERACDDQLAQLGGAFHTAQAAEFAALNALARHIDTTVPAAAPDQPTAVPFLLFNPHETAFGGQVELEAQLDWRPIAGYTDTRTALVPIEVRDANGMAVPFQKIHAENRSMTNLVWRVRVAFPVRLAPGGWEVVTVKYQEQPQLAPRVTAVTASDDSTITNGRHTVRARRDAIGVEVLADGRPLVGGNGLGVWLYNDPYGSWGGLREEPESFRLTRVREIFSVREVRVLESGTELARLWVRFAGARSRLDLTFTLRADRAAIDLAGRLFLDDRSARVKIVLPGAFTTTCFEVPGGEIERGPLGEVPGIGAVLASSRAGALGFASDALYGFSLTDGALQVSIARASRYADDVPTSAGALPHLPAVDCGELRFKCVLTAGGSGLAAESRFLQQPPLVQSVPATPGPLLRRGSLWSLDAGVEVLALRPEGERDVRLWVQNTRAAPLSPTLVWAGATLRAPELPPHRIVGWTLRPAGGAWTLHV